MDIRIEPAHTRLEEVRALFREYTRWLGVDLCFQDYDRELAELPGDCTWPWWMGLRRGAWPSAPRRRGSVNSSGSLCAPASGATGWGSRVAGRAVADARGAEYRRMLLDTLPRMGSAMRLYEGMGFQETQAYYDTPLRETRFYCLRLGE